MYFFNGYRESIQVSSLGAASLNKHFIVTKLWRHSETEMRKREIENDGIQWKEEIVFSQGGEDKQSYSWLKCTSCLIGYSPRYSKYKKKLGFRNYKLSCIPMYIKNKSIYRTKEPNSLFFRPPTSPVRWCFACTFRIWTCRESMDILGLALLTVSHRTRFSHSSHMWGNTKKKKEGSCLPSWGTGSIPKICLGHKTWFTHMLSDEFGVNMFRTTLLSSTGYKSYDKERLLRTNKSQLV